MMVDAMNKEVGEYKDGKYDTLPNPGDNLTCTIDATLQAYGEKLMQNKAGSIVAIDPETGEIFALVSSPTYDPNMLVGSVRAKNYGKLLQDSIDVPLFNRALMAMYPPGSTFKTIEALIGQQEGVLNTETSYTCPGAFHLEIFRLPVMLPWHPSIRKSHCAFLQHLFLQCFHEHHEQ